MVKVSLEKVNAYTTKLVADGKEVILTDLAARDKYYGKIKEFVITVVLMLVMVLIFTVPLLYSPKEEKYKEEYKTQEGSLIDLDGDGLYYIEE